MKTIFAALFAVLALASCAAPQVAAAQANTSNYMSQGGATWHVGGTLAVDTGGVVTADKSTATANSGNSYAVTMNAMSGVVTTNSLTTAAAGSQAITITNSKVSASSVIIVSWAGGTNVAGTPVIKAVPTGTTITITIYNKHASAAFSGTMILHFLVL